jgi:Transcriptional regulator, AbiEi antitoxin
MDFDPLRHIAEQDGFFTRRHAAQAGYADREVARMVRAKVWRRIRRGVYVFADTWAGLDEVARHRIRSSAVLLSLGDAVALSHASGVIRHGIDVWGLDLMRVHVTRLDGGAGRFEGDVVHHEGFWVDNDVIEVDGQRVLRAERCVLEAGSRTSNEKALCLMEAGLRAKSFDRARLDAAYDLMRHWPFARHLAIPLGIVSEHSGSIGESRGNWFFHHAGLPRPEPQFEVRRPDGSIAGITDWWWAEQRVMGEFDGRVKYGRLLKPDQDPGDAVFAEKRREDELRELTGATMVRLIWIDYETTAATRARLARILGLAG